MLFSEAMITEAYMDNCEKNINFVSKVENEKTDYIEGMTSISAVFRGIEQGFSDRRVIRVFFDRERIAKKEKEYRFLLAKAKQHHFEIEMQEREYLDGIVTGHTHGGIVALCTQRHIPSLTDALQTPSLPFSDKNRFFVMLEGIEDPYNFGYTLRSLYAAGADGILLSPRNWMDVAGIVARSAAGASEMLPMAIAEPEEAVQLLRQNGYRVACAGIRDSVSMYEADPRVPLLLVVGGEKRGISSAVLSKTDVVVRIDYGRNFQGSLSAASAATVLAFEVLHQNRIEH
jgi:23S rRNA (guanosine2251-2'-O)-methyltransferase